MTLTHEPSEGRLGFQLAYGDTDTVGIAYFGIYFDLPAITENVTKLTRVLKIDDGVMRHMATRRPEGGPSEPVAVGAAIGDDGDTAPVDAPEEE